MIFTLFSSLVAAGMYRHHYRYADYGDSYETFPTCKHYVEKPSWGGDGKPYGYEDGKSCIAQDGKYGKSEYSTEYKPEYESRDYKSEYEPEYKSEYNDDYKQEQYQEKKYLAADYGYGYEPKHRGYGYKIRHHQYY